MAKIAYILLCHKDPDGIIAQAQRLTAAGDFMSIHFDGRAKKADYDRIRAALADNPAVTFARRRIKCGWGEWSLVEATIEAVRAAVDRFPHASHFYMLSGDCMCIKSAEYAHAFLDREDVDYIESFDFHSSGWIKTGIKSERLIYRHWFNERSNKTAFYTSLEWQKRLGLERKVPEDLQIMIGSQWWCLRRRTIEALLEFIDSRRDVMRFFRTTWIPDETFFQTLVHHLIPAAEIRTRTLTFLIFTDYGMPVTFYNDQYDLLIGQDYLFARKLSPDALDLKTRLGELYTASGRQFPISNEGRRLFRFLSGRGRIGRRFAPRFWEVSSSLGRERRLLIVTCKKWHVAKRLVDRVSQVTQIPGVHYLFNEDSCALPDLGGIQTTLEKRMRHRRALTRMLFDTFGSDRMMICIDPANFELIQDFYADKSDIHLLEIDCRFSDEYLIGHARRVGLAGERTSQDVLDRVLPTIRFDMRFEADRLQTSGFEGLHRLREGAPSEESAQALARFLGVPTETAKEILSVDYLFLD